MSNKNWPLNIHSFSNGNVILLGYIDGQKISNFSESFRIEAHLHCQDIALQDSTVESLKSLSKIINSTRITCHLSDLLNKILEQQSK